LPDIYIEARLTTDHPMSAYGQKILVLETGEALRAGDASLAYCRVSQATANEKAELLEAEYCIQMARKVKG